MRRAILGSAFESFAADDRKVKSCEYHRPDWTKAAEVACSLVERGLTGDMHAFDLASKEAGLDECTRWAALSFLVEPIFVDGPRLGNGQHRVCAMKMAGVERCPIEN